MRTLVRTAGLALLALLAIAPTAGASTLSVSGNKARYSGDPSADSVRVQRYIDSRNNVSYYLVSDSGGISAQSPCIPVPETNGTMGACRITSGLGYELNTGDGNDTVAIVGGTPGGGTNLGAGNDTFAGTNAGDVVHGGEGNDILKGAAGNDRIFGDGGNDQVAGEAGNDAVDGGAGDDQLEFGGDEMVAGAGVGADDIRGGPGFDRLSYLDHGSAVRVSLDDRAGDGTAGEGDNAHGDIEVLVGSTLNDVLTGNDGPQQLFGNAGNDRVDGLGGDDIVNGGTGDDELFGGGGMDRIEGSAGEDYLEGGAGEDLFEGDNVCSAEPCTGGSDFVQARDGEADTVNCGVGADTALVDDVDVVALDTQHGCERVDRSAAAAPPADGGVLGVAASGPRLRVIGVRRLSTLRRGKFKVEVTCPGSCKVRARMISGRTVIASKTGTRLGAGKILLKPKTSKKGRKLLKRRTKVGITLAVDVTDDKGQVTTLARVLSFRRK